METRTLSEVARLKLQNCNLTIQVLQAQGREILRLKNEILAEEFQRLKCKPEEWTVNENNWQLIEKPKPQDKKPESKK